MRLQNSKFGMACLITGITAFVAYITLGQIELMLGLANRGLSIQTLELFGKLILIIPTTTALIAMGLGVAALRIKNKKKEYAIFGMAFAAFPLVLNLSALLIGSFLEGNATL